MLLRLVSFVFMCPGIKACMEAMEHVNEERYEINVDIHGMRNGPRLGRQRVINMVGIYFIQPHHLFLTVVGYLIFSDITI